MYEAISQKVLIKDYNISEVSGQSYPSLYITHTHVHAVHAHTHIPFVWYLKNYWSNQAQILYAYVMWSANHIT